MLILGLALVFIGLVPLGLLFLSISHARTHPEVSTEQFIVPANDETIIKVVSKDGRYEYRFSSPDSFDGYLLQDLDQVASYKARESFKGDQAKNVKHWQTFMQTGVGSDFAIVLVNRAKKETPIQMQLTFFSNPAFFEGRLGLLLVPIGILLTIAGTIMTVIALIQ